MKQHLTILILAFATLLVAAPAMAQSAEDEIADRIRASFEDQRQGGQSMDFYSKEGALNFWSSGGLLQETSPEPPEEPTLADLYPKHINVIVHGDAAAAFYYSEGTMTPPGGERITNYLTRVMEFWIKEDGKWVIRGAHYSPLQGGQGTTQVTP